MDKKTEENLWKGLAAANDNDHRKAIDYLRRARVSDPTNPRILTPLGLSYYQLGNDREAYRHLKRSVLFDPAQPKVQEILNHLDTERKAAQATGLRRLATWRIYPALCILLLPIPIAIQLSRMKMDRIASIVVWIPFVFLFFLASYAPVRWTLGNLPNAWKYLKTKTQVGEKPFFWTEIVYPILMTLLSVLLIFPDSGVEVVLSDWGLIVCLSFLSITLGVTIAVGLRANGSFWCFSAGSLALVLFLAMLGWSPPKEPLFDRIVLPAFFHSVRVLICTRIFLFGVVLGTWIPIFFLEEEEKKKGGAEKHPGPIEH
jgi:hypothetical protein